MGNIAISSNRSNMYTNISNDFIDKFNKILPSIERKI